MRAIALLAMALAAPALDIVCDGVLGQSQPAEAEPCQTIGFSGVATRGGEVWAAAGHLLALFVPDAQGRMVMRAGLTLPAASASGACLWNHGDRLLVQLLDDRLAIVDPAAKRIEGFVPLPQETKRIFCPAARGAGANAYAILALAGNAIHGLDLDGKAPRRLAVLADAKDSTCHAIGADAATGDILAATTYPDRSQYRYDGRTGMRTEQPGWPIQGSTIEQFVQVQRETWTLRSGGTITTAPDGAGRPVAWSFYSNACAPAAGRGWWIASSQGLLRLAGPEARVTRLGGLPSVRACSLSESGEVLALAEQGQRIVRFDRAAAPDAPPASAGNEPWRVGGGWTARGSAILPCPDGNLVLDETAGKVWQFAPQPGNEASPTWTARCADGALHAPQAMALAAGRLWVVQDSTVFVGDPGEAQIRFRMASMALPEGFVVQTIASAGDATLYLASPTRVARLDPADESFTATWTSPQVSSVSALAASGGLVAMAEATEGRISILEGRTGAVLATITGTAVPGGRMEPVALAFAKPWLVAVDRAGARLLRFRVGS